MQPSYSSPKLGTVRIERVPKPMQALYSEFYTLDYWHTAKIHERLGLGVSRNRRLTDPLPNINSIS